MDASSYCLANSKRLADRRTNFRNTTWVMDEKFLLPLSLLSFGLVITTQKVSGEQIIPAEMTILQGHLFIALHYDFPTRLSGNKKIK
jgi:hypothetical protein